MSSPVFFLVQNPERQSRQSCRAKSTDHPLCEPQASDKHPLQRLIKTSGCSACQFASAAAFRGPRRSACCSWHRRGIADIGGKERRETYSPCRSCRSDTRLRRRRLFFRSLMLIKPKVSIVGTTAAISAAAEVHRSFPGNTETRQRFANER